MDAHVHQVASVAVRGLQLGIFILLSVWIFGYLGGMDTDTWVGSSSLLLFFFFFFFFFLFLRVPRSSRRGRRRRRRRSRRCQSHAHRPVLSQSRRPIDPSNHKRAGLSLAPVVKDGADPETNETVRGCLDGRVAAPYPRPLSTPPHALFRSAL